MESKTTESHLLAARQNDHLLELDCSLGMQQQELPFFAFHFLNRISGGQKPVKAD
jgi:hypothetical protein